MTFDPVCVFRRSSSCRRRVKVSRARCWRKQQSSWWAASECVPATSQYTHIDIRISYWFCSLSQEIETLITASYRSCFYLCSRAGIEDSKKWGMMFLSNQLFKIYFKVWTHCELLIRYWLKLTEYSATWKKIWEQRRLLGPKLGKYYENKVVILEEKVEISAIKSQHVQNKILGHCEENNIIF